MSQIFLSPFAMPELDRVVEQLCAPSSLEGVFHRSTMRPCLRWTCWEKSCRA